MAGDELMHVLWHSSLGGFTHIILQEWDGSRSDYHCLFSGILRSDAFKDNRLSQQLVSH